jgi:hypothetical protein
MRMSNLLTANVVQGETIGNLNIPAVLEYRVKTNTHNHSKKLQPTMDLAQNLCTWSKVCQLSRR